MGRIQTTASKEDIHISFFYTLPYTFFVTGKDFRVEIRFPKINFSSEMMVPESLAFEEVKRNITSAVSKKPLSPAAGFVAPSEFLMNGNDGCDMICSCCLLFRHVARS